MLNMMSGILNSIVKPRRAKNTSKNKSEQAKDVYDFDTLAPPQVEQNAEAAASPVDEKTQGGKRNSHNTRAKLAKEPELIEITSSDDEESNCRVKAESNQAAGVKVENDSKSANKHDQTIQWIDDKFSFQPWNILQTDLEIRNLNGKSLTNHEFEFNNSIIFARFGKTEFKGGYASFRTDKGITLMSKDCENQIAITIGKEDIVYCAAFCHEKLNILFLQPTSYFTILFRKKLESILDPNSDSLNPNSTDETLRRIVVLINVNKPSSSLGSYIQSYFQHIFREGTGRMDFIKLPKARELATLSLGIEVFDQIFNKSCLKDTSELSRIIAKYPSTAEKSDSLNITLGDLKCLDEGEFLNDNIISFYLKYLMNEKMKEADNNSTHMFNTFFYNRLTQRNKGSKDQNSTNSNPAQRRHARVKKWTKYVNIFEKDFVIIPINKNAHWYLAIICYPSLTAPVYSNEKRTNESFEAAIDENNTNLTTAKISSPVNVTESKSKIEIPMLNTNNHLNEGGGIHIEIDEDSYDEVESTNEDSLVNAPVANENRVCTKMPCILVFDSLSTRQSWNVVGTLREYLQCEWEAKYPNTKRSFTKENFFGARVKVPSQNNFFDCGIYLLQYVESFFSNRIKDFNPPLNLNNWFPDETIKNKRESIKNLIYDLEKQQKKLNIKYGLKVEEKQEEEEEEEEGEMNENKSSVNGGGVSSVKKNTRSLSQESLDENNILEALSNNKVFDNSHKKCKYDDVSKGQRRKSANNEVTSTTTTTKDIINDINTL